MKQKGQVFSLDVMISIVLIVVVLGVAMRFFELKATETKEITEQLELERAGKTAAELLINNPIIICELTHKGTGAKLDSLSNCIEPNQTITKTDLGLANGGFPTDPYDCRVVMEYFDGPTNVNISTVLPGDCTAIVPATEKNVYAVKRQIIVTNLLPAPQKQVTKNYLNDCTDNEAATTCLFTDGNVSIWVWKNE